MLGISYGELFLILGATAALIGPKDLPIIARTAGRLAGRAIGYVQLARGQFDSVMQQTQARQVHKELQDTIAQLEAIRHEIRSVSMLNPGPTTRRFIDNVDQVPSNNVEDKGNVVSEERELKQNISTASISKDFGSTTSESSNLHSQASAFAKLAESSSLKNGSMKGEIDMEKLRDELGLLSVLPVSAESAGLLPKRKDDVKGSDIVLEAIVEEEVAQNAKEFFSQSQNQLKIE